MCSVGVRKSPGMAGMDPLAFLGSIPEMLVRIRAESEFGQIMDALNFGSA